MCQILKEMLDDEKLLMLNKFLILKSAKLTKENHIQKIIYFKKSVKLYKRCYR